jgi:DnaJ-class molecular chaperone
MSEYRKISSEKVVCPKCDGEGVEWTGGWSYKNESPTERKCELCRGTGEVSPDKARAHRNGHLGK